MKRLQRQPCLLLALVLLATGCDEPSPAQSHALGRSASTRQATLEPWTLGALSNDGSWSIPIPCRPHNTALRAPLRVAPSIQTASQLLGHILLHERRVGAKANTYSFGLLKMRRGTSPVIDSITTKSPHVLFSKNAKHWLFATQHNGTIQLRDGKSQSSWPGDELLDLRCEPDLGCALLSRKGGQLQTQLAGSEQRPIQWPRPQAIPDSNGAKPLGIVQLKRAKRASPDVRVAVQQGHELIDLSIAASGRLASHRRGTLKRKQHVHAIGPEWTLVGPTPSTASCGTGAAELRLMHSDGSQYRLQSPTVPQQAQIVNMGARAAVAWLAAPHCRSQARTVYAVVAKRGHGPVGPLSTVANAQTFRMAAHGQRLDLWLVEARQATYLRLDCGRASRPAKSNEASSKAPAPPR